MYKRPLFAASIGFVLGEVCAWQAESGEGIKMAFLAGAGKLWWRIGVPGAVLMLILIFMAFRDAAAGKTAKKSRGMHNYLWMLLLLCIFSLGYGRMVREIQVWKEMEEGLWENEEVVCFKGQVRDIREKERTIAITLKTETMGKILVYVEKEEVKEKGIKEKEVKDLPAKERWLLEELPIGSVVEVKGEVSRFLEAGNPGQFDRRAYYRTQGVLVSVFAWEVCQDEEGKNRDGSPYLDALYRVRRFCSQRFMQICEPEDQGIFCAAILGEKEGMDQEIKDLYQDNGIAHLLAISGLHLSLIGAGLHRLLRKCGLGYGSSGILAAVGICSYGLCTGASVSAMRGVIMLSASFLAAYLGKTYDVLSALSLALLLLAGKQPFSIIQSGFQLSFGAVLGIGIIGRAMEKGLGLKKNWMKGLAVSVAVQLATGPVVLWHYFQIPVYGVVLNLAVVPLMGYVVISGLMGLGAGMVSIEAGVMAVGTGHYILRFYQKLCQAASKLPGHYLLWGRPEVWQIFLYYVVLGGMVAALYREGKRRKAAINQGQEEKGWNLKGWGIMFVGILICCLSVRPRPQHGLDIAVLDVGQGDGIVLQCEGGEIRTEGIVWLGKEEEAEKKEGVEEAEGIENAEEKEGIEGAEGIKRKRTGKRAVILMDGGSTSDKRVGENRLEPYVKFEGISQIDFAIVSHGDEDHISGLRYLLTDCPEIGIGCLLLPEAGRGDEGYEKLIAAAKKRGVPVGYMDAGDWICAGECRLTCFYPGKEMEADFSDRNQQSLVLRADYQDFHMLFTGDVGQEGERMALDYAGEEEFSMVQVLKAAHHGSRFSNGEELLAALHPAWTVISYEEGNSYGHPHEETLERLREEGSLILETGKMGAVLMHVEKGKVRYWGYR